MGVLKITNFGGEIPRVLPQALPEGAAQINQDLLATSIDFRPVMKPTHDGGGSGTAMTLYRMPGAGGMGRYGDDRSFVRGQLNDDTLERTFYTHNNSANNGGSSPPYGITNTNYMYRLGVPAPEKTKVGLLTSEKFTYDKAVTWLNTDLVPAVVKAITNNVDEDQRNARFSLGPGNGLLEDMQYLVPADINNPTVAGVTTWPDESTHLGVANSGVKFQFFPRGPLSQRGAMEPWVILFRVPRTLAPIAGVGNPQLGGVEAFDGFGDLTQGSPVWVGVAALPLWGVIDLPGFINDAKLINSPKTGARLLSDDQINGIQSELINIYSTTGTELMSKRHELDAAVKAFSDAGAKAVSLSQEPTSEPVGPPLPVQTQFIYQGGGSGADAIQVYNTAYDAWKLLNDKYNADKAKYDADHAEWLSGCASLVAAMVEAQAKALSITQEIEAMYAARKSGLTDTITAYFSKVRLEKTADNIDGLIPIDPDTNKDTRFYFTTWVTDLGEESAPSPVSDKIDVESGDIVSISRPSIVGLQGTAVRILKAWRIYRSNTGNGATAFQFVKEVALAYTVLAPVVGDVGSTESDIPGLVLTHKWRDIVATWQVYQHRGITGTSLDLYVDTSHLEIGDTVTQIDTRTVAGGGTGYACTQTWNGARWTMQSVPDCSKVKNTTAWLDGKTGDQLGEVCPSITWAEPPVVNSQYLQGLVGVPNGIMAGFIGNMVAFCEPYIPYAWPVEYQIPLEFKIVGMCAFGQSILVGTKVNPYIISGSDSASMSAQKLDVAQSCESRRSMVAALGGVFYASPDGYCFASHSGVEVITQGLFSREDWQKLNPSSILAVVHDSVLYFWYTKTNGERGCYGLDLVAKKLTRHNLTADAVFDDTASDSIYIVNNGGVYKLFDSAGQRAVGKWKSGIAVLPSQASFAWLQVQSDFAPASVAITWHRWENDIYTTHSTTVTSSEPVRLPPGRFLKHAIEVDSAARVISVTMASSTDELKSV